MIIPVILSGGHGSRLWPVSREFYPKPFVKIVDSMTMLQETALRICGLEGIQAPVISCDHRHRTLVEQQLAQIKVEPASIILEPVRRGTAPAVTAVALYILSRGMDPVLLVLPSDHYIADTQAFYAALNEGSRHAEKGYLVTFGIAPLYPATGYGYILCGDSASIECHGSCADSSRALKIRRFEEKPDREKARMYYESGEFLWNSGIFMFRASSIVDEMIKFEPEIVECCRKALPIDVRKYGAIHLHPEIFGTCSYKSLDRGVMERTDRAVVIPMEAGWTDLGSWDEVWQVAEKDTDHNVLKGDVVVQDVKGSYICSTGRVVGAVALKDIIIVECPDSVLVSSRDNAQKVEELVEKLRVLNRDEIKSYQGFEDPFSRLNLWENKIGFRVRPLSAQPYEKMVFKPHALRAVYLILLNGGALLNMNGKSSILENRDCAAIPPGANWSFENQSDELLGFLLIEIEDVCLEAAI